ncbi:ribulose-phosphate 3-epimerase [Wolbachia endosymbiont of Diaphorina citri]|jgi:ribulose-phosphate 3-epimerase|uniref:ribulose-phosphate 3-epimerase n=1 Tax=Wolbachia endosymbiont of Diaphorina citri TaxID=116598 RepID=UPI0002E580BB|nr:ribulose-phosphate 3-epimerase [Wolbachia endosymbiont of Diaphorina citri]QJT94385.1 ribulose-phosphate 3-epimerase [Wolbachia endosymbiont of Diaphorina citri]QJT95625.1 ribulose-phosphate 3-epimerase [Wolbachia endosymbiont of Diaphorina citri]QJT96987.1 ribulose-phosphate 3-epimerase [Wolbachia endosymbiont of Diaphorina citri]QLK11283.1 ribulose-phosphate 3-epimerase [Wolbachia endosymbiont of Diaphorina citri]QXY87186.1 ribulose-phosphate 3-epimerase [Wolbachia endosymbiont of Diaphor
MGIKIAPSILSADFAKLGEEVKRISDLNVDYIHIDVMDGNFVPNITIGPNVISAIRKYSNLPFDVHLMIKSPGDHIESFINAGADIITIHAEAEIHLERLVRKIKSYKNNTKKIIQVGVSIVPSTSPSVLEYIIDELDIVLIMTVNPGFGGQEFIHSQLSKISTVRKMIQDRNLKTQVSVDGGVNFSNAADIIKAGANILVAGSAIFKAEDMKKTINDLKNLSL